MEWCKEVLALLGILYIGYTMLVSREIKVLTRHSTLAWLVKSSGLNERLERWGVVIVLSARDQEVQKRDDDILGTLASSIIPREEVDKMLIAIAPQKQPNYYISMPLPTVEGVLVVRWLVVIDRSEQNEKAGHKAQYMKAPGIKDSDCCSRKCDGLDSE